MPGWATSGHKAPGASVARQLPRHPGCRGSLLLASCPSRQLVEPCSAGTGLRLPQGTGWRRGCAGVASGRWLVAGGGWLVAGPRAPCPTALGGNNASRPALPAPPSAC